MKINEKHHQTRISTSRRVNIIGQNNFSITFALRQRGKGTGTHPEDFRTSETPAMGSNIVPRRHTQLRTHARTKRIRVPSWTHPHPHIYIYISISIYIYTYTYFLHIYLSIHIYMQCFSFVLFFVQFFMAII